MISAIVAVVGYTIISGSKPCLKDRVETAMVIGEIIMSDMPMVAVITKNTAVKSAIVAPQRNVPNNDAVNPIVTLLTKANVTVAYNSR